MDEAAGRARVKPGWRAPLAFFAGTWALLAVFRAHAPLHLDTARDLLIARDCVLAGHCPGAGPRSSFGGLMQGALWSHLLELREHAGFGLAALERTADLLLAAAAALVPLIARRMGAPANALTWALWLPATLLTIGYPRLWNPTPWPLALAAFHLALAGAASRGGALACAAAGVGLALAVEVHVATAVLVPLLAGVVVAYASRPLPALTLAAGGFVAAVALDSPGALAENVAILRPHAPSIACTLGVAVAAGAAARRRGARAGERAARRAALAVIVYTVAVLTITAAASGHGLDPRYFAPVVTPAAIVLAGWLDARALRASARLRAACAGLVVLGHVGLWAAQRRIDRQFRVIEAEAIAAELYGRGLAFGDLYRRVRGPRAFDLVAVLAALEPDDGRTAGQDGRDLLIVRASRAALPAPAPGDWTLVELGAGQVAVIVAYAPWVQIDPLTICGEAGDCEAVRADVERFSPAAGARWTARAHAGIVDLRRFAGATAVTYHLPVRAPAGGGRREVVLFSDDCRRWQIEGDARLTAGEGPRTLTLTVTPGPRCRGWLPPFAELAEGDAALAKLIAAARRDEPRD